MNRKLPVASDVRAAIADTRRMLHAARVAAVPAWERAGHGECRFCEETGALVRPAGKPAITVCEQSAGDLWLSTLTPQPGPTAELVLAAAERWMTQQPGEPAPARWQPPPERCAVCDREGRDVAHIAAGPFFALCSDCIARAADAALDDPTRAGFLAAETQAALHELDDLARLKQLQGAAAVTRDPSLVLSMIRLLTTPDERVQQKLAELVRSLG